MRSTSMYNTLSQAYTCGRTFVANTSYFSFVILHLLLVFVCLKIIFSDFYFEKIPDFSC